MKIGHKLTLGFVGLTVLMAALGYICLRTSQATLEQAIGKSSAGLVEQVMNKIDKDIYHRIEEIQVYATGALAKEQILLSNARFENLSDPNTYIEQVESEWTSQGNELTPVMEELNNNELAKELQSRKKFYLNKYGYPLLAEFFITNKFGVNVAQTNKTTAYFQADEEWWQRARQDGMFVSRIKYDESSGTFSYDIGIRIEDVNGNFIGVAKAVLNSQEIIDTINRAKISSEYKTAQLCLVNQDARILYSTKGNDFLIDAKNQFIPRFGHPDQPGHKLYAIDKTTGEKEVLFTHARSKGYKDFKGLGRALFMEIDSAEVFAPIVNLRNTLLLTGLTIMSLALLASSVTYRSVVIPIAELHKATVQIAAGNLDTNLEQGEKDEIGQLTGSLQQMARQLKKTITDLNDEINGRKKTEEKLRENQQFLGDIFNSIQDGIGIMDKDLNITMVNPWIADMHPESKPLVGKKCFAAYRNRDSACPECPCAKTLKTGTPHSTVIPNPCSKRQDKWVAITSFPLKDHKGNITGVIEYVRDITEQRKTEQALMMSEQRFSQVVENAKEWVWETDANGLYTYASSVVKEILGFSPEEIVGKKHFYDLFHPEDREALKKATYDTFAKKASFQKSLNRNIHKDGHTLCLSTSAMPILDEKGELLGYRGVDADITEQIKAEALLAERTEQIMHHHNTLLKLANIPEQDLDSLFRLITEQDSEVLNVAQVGIGFFNPDSTEIVCRDLFIKAQKAHETGHSLKTRDYPHYFKAMENSRILATNNSLSDMRTCEFAESYLKPKGINSMMHVPIRLHGQMIGIICHEHIGPAREWTSTEQDFAASIADMISLKLEAAERTKAEQDLERLNKELEVAVQELSMSNRQLHDFVHIAAHDLKTPVRGIGTLADWIISDYGDKLDERGREQVRLLKARVVRIDKLIEGMLQFSKIARNKSNEKKVNLNKAVSDAINKIKPAKNIDIAVDSLPNLTCERNHILQVFENLLSNAVSFMDKPRGLIKVGCVEQGNSWKFYVCDNGPGIEQKHFDRIFKIFQTLQNKEELESTGIGLAVTKKIIELYGGKIWVESQLGKGSTFFFTFPKQQEESVNEPTKTHITC